MANRNTQQKRQKMRRAYLKKPRKLGAERNHPILEMQRISAASLARDEIALRKTISEERYQALLARQVILKKERLVVYRTVGELCPDLMFFKVVDNNHHSCRCFFTADKKCYILVYEEFTHRRIRRSMSYADKDRCISAFHSGKTVWVETRVLPKPETPS